ncbi:MAG: universal stress protein [Bacteroidetes bacterium]|nr:universal stress protein [Bacteroidota bacterium]
MEIKKILVPYEGSPSSEIALRKAVLCAKIFGAEITVVFVVTDSTAAAMAEKVKEVTIGKYQDRGVQMNFVQRKGRIYKEITTVEKEIEADLIMMGTHGAKGFQENWIGTNAFRVVSSSKCPVLTMQELPYPDSFQKILLPLNDTDQTRQKIPVVTKLARGFDAEVVIFCVSARKDEQTINKLRLYAKQAKEYLDKNNVTNSAAEEYGRNVADACVDFAKKNGVDLISIMTETETTNSFFMGTYAQQLVHHSSIPVLSVHARSLSLEGAIFAS